MDQFQVDRRNLIAKLPQLGPLIGWTRKQAEAWTARLWVKADDDDGQRACLALTSRWQADPGARGCSKLVPGSAQLWRILLVRLGDEQPCTEERFALADVKFPESGEGSVYRIVTLHVARTHRDNGGPAEELRGECEPLVFDAAGRLGDAQAAGLEAHLESISLDELATELFDDLAKHLAGQRDPRRALPPERQRKAEMSDCEVELRPTLAERSTALPLRFAVGCCRHPGVQFDTERSERALGAVARLAAGEDGPAFALMLGDQIYADATAGVLDMEEGLERYSVRYWEAFRAPRFRELTRRLPVYMTADDHEIRDNWPREQDSRQRSGRDPFEKDRGVQWAWLQFLAHQRCHGPNARLLDCEPRRDERPSLGYAFEAGEFQFFAFDTRFERTPTGRELFSKRQLDAFDAWLAALHGDPNRPKFVLSGSVFAPGENEFTLHAAYGRRADTWQGYPESRAAVAERIVQRQVQNVVFLAGDFHCGAVAALNFLRDGQKTALRAYAVVAPPFYSPFPFVDLPARDVARQEVFRWNERWAFECKSRALATQGFAVISVHKVANDGMADDWKLEVRYHLPEADPAALGVLHNGRAELTRFEPALAPSIRRRIAHQKVVATN